MAFKTISLSEDAYRLLRARKRQGESFTEVVRRLAGPPTAEEFEALLDVEEAEELQALAESLDHRAERELVKAARRKRS
ncbi:MAG: antitoxin VapB family protein [Euryarchaeota archaeon]|nr:antitoxin VapB family protein [Euryarchaeota archaeon]